MEEKVYLNAEELLEQVNQIISKSEIQPPSRKSSSSLDLRTLRYFVSLGIISAPFAPKLGMGARAYNYEHLVKIVATRRLQEKSYSLSAIKGMLKDMPISEVTKIANFDASLSDLKPLETKPLKTSGLKPSKLRLQSQISLKLAKGVTLVIEDRELSDYDLKAIEEIAISLVNALPRPQKKEEEK